MNGILRVLYIINNQNSQANKLYSRATCKVNIVKLRCNKNQKKFQSSETAKFERVI